MSHERGELETADGIVDDTRISFFVVGYWPQDESVFIKSLNPQKIWDGLDDFETQSVLRYICIQAVNPKFPDEPATLIGVVRVVREGENFGYYHTLLPLLNGEPNPSERDALILETAGARIAHARGENPKPGDLEFFMSGIQFVERELNHTFGQGEE